MAELSDYIGIPWQLGGHTRASADCWGLCLLVLKDCYGINLNRFVGATYTGDELAEIVNSETSSRDWRLVKMPESGDLCVMSTGENCRAEHIGIYAYGNILHALGKNGQGVSSVNKPRALNKMFKKMEYYRFVGNDNNS